MNKEEFFQTRINGKIFTIGLWPSIAGYFAYAKPGDSYRISEHEIGPGFSKTSSDEAILKLVKQLETL